MVDTIVWVVFGFAVIIALGFAFRYFKGSGGKTREPIIELEPLVNCTSCESLIPEGVKRCAFCGATQTTRDVGKKDRANN